MSRAAAAKAGASKPESNGGSRKMSSNDAYGQRAAAARASPATISTWLAVSLRFVCESCSTSCRLLSINVTCRAPREASSKPSTPVPAKKSNPRTSSSAGTRCSIQLNNVSRTRSGVGRKPGVSATGSGVRFHCPPMMRTRLGVCDATFARRCFVTLPFDGRPGVPCISRATFSPFDPPFDRPLAIAR